MRDYQRWDRVVAHILLDGGCLMMWVKVKEKGEYIQSMLFSTIKRYKYTIDKNRLFCYPMRTSNI
jgi:hypothetical protein